MSEEVIRIIGHVVTALAVAVVAYLVGTSMASASEPVRIAVIDSGINQGPYKFKLCETGHKDFTGTGLSDDLGHGTAVASIISRHIADVNACIVVIKVFSAQRRNHMLAYLAGLKYVTNLDVKYVNMSLAGFKPHLSEEIYIQRLLAQGKRIIAAIGNEGHNFDRIGCLTYPACYDSRIVIVGDSVKKKLRNWGRMVDYYDNGGKQRAGGYVMEGTSMAAAHVSGKLAAGVLK